MLKHKLTFSFSTAMRLGVFFLLCVVQFKVFAQDKTLDGIVFDKYTKTRIAKVNIRNLSTNRAVYNNLKGEFTINANPGDLLVFSKDDYIADTVKVQGYTSQAIYLAPEGGIQLNEVTIKDTLQTPQQKLLATKRDYTKIYGRITDEDMLSTSQGEGAGISIDALYNLFSRSSHNAERLQGVIQRDYYQNVIDYRFNRSFVGRITGLKGIQLTDFMQRYRPGYFFISSATEYDLIVSIKANLKRYLRRPKALAIQPLVPAAD